MAEELEGGSTDETAGGGAEMPALVQRVARLEAELAELKRQIGRPLPPAAVRQAAADRPAAMPPMPPIPPRPQEAARGGLASKARMQPAPATHARESLEDRLGSQIFNRIGIVLLLIGTAWFLKYAVDREWIGPAGRVIAGLFAGAGIVLWSERFRKSGFAAFSYSLKALGSGVLYLSLWAALRIYHLLPPGAALGLMVLVTAWNAWMAWAQDSELLAAYALTGGFATPMLLSTGGNHETFLFTYLLAIDMAVVMLVRLRGWPKLLLGAFPLTMAFFIGWFAEFYTAREMMLTSVFIMLFDSTFSSAPLGRGGATRSRLAVRVEDILLPLANAAFLSLAFYSVLQDSGHHDLLPWLMLVLAAVYLAFMRLPQSRVAEAIHLSIAVVFLTIAIPLKASGHWITASWLVEGLALLLVATRIEPADAAIHSEESYAGRTLIGLGSAALLLGLCGILYHWFGDVFTAVVPFFGADTGTALLGVAMFAGAAWLALRRRPVRGWIEVGSLAVVAVELVAVLLTLREILYGGPPEIHSPFATADLTRALVGLAIFAAVVAVSRRMAKAKPGAEFWPRCAGMSTVVFNLVAVLTGVREIGAIWEPALAVRGGNPDAALQQALAISGFLMVYGAALLAVGFWKRTAFLRWQALLLLVFTIFKAFLYDMRNLSQGYRVVSFLALGALLMAISFAYQKDWLGLREPNAEDSTGSSEAAG